MISEIGNFAKIAVDQGGHIIPLVIDTSKIIGPSLTNPSILNYNGKLLVNLRNVNYILYHAEHGVNEHTWGPLCYLHTEQHQVLATNNILCELDHNFNISGNSIIDTSKLDVKPLWQFIGLEDARLVVWDSKLYLSGVRRDTTTNGEGRMELSQIVVEDNQAKEIHRQRMPAPPPNGSYCEKNWMPVIDKPYHFVKWTNPTELVQYDPNSKTTKTVFTKSFVQLDTVDLRGGSQVIPYKNHYLAVVHEVNLFRTESGQKNATYRHRFVLWDKDFNLLRVSPRFDFMDAQVEFACGMTEYNNQILITFGFQDNASYLLVANKSTINQLIGL